MEERAQISELPLSIYGERLATARPPSVRCWPAVGRLSVEIRRSGGVRLLNHAPLDARACLAGPVTVARWMMRATSRWLGLMACSGAAILAGAKIP